MMMPGLSLRGWATIVSVALLVAVVRVEEARVAGARKRASALALQAANTRAERDSTRRVGARNERVAHLLHDSLRLAERLVVQREQRQDELDRALRRERIARYRASVVADSLDALARGVVTASPVDSVRLLRRGTFLVRQVPYTISAEVALPEAPDTGVMSVHVALDTLRLETRVGCAAPDMNGVREATVLVTGPTWATVRFYGMEQSPEVCVSPAIAQARRRHSWLNGIPIVIGAGSVLDRSGRVSWGVFVGMGLAASR